MLEWREELSNHEQAVGKKRVRQILDGGSLPRKLPRLSSIAQPRMQASDFYEEYIIQMCLHRKEKSEGLDEDFGKKIGDYFQPDFRFYTPK